MPEVGLLLSMWCVGTPPVVRVKDQAGIDNNFVTHPTSDLNAFSKNQIAPKVSSEIEVCSKVTK